MPACLVTGAARRIGRALSLEAARAGFAVAIHHRDAFDDARTLAEDILVRGGQAVVVSADLADPESAGPLIEAAAKALGPLTLLVNNASLFQDDRFGALGEGFDAHMAVNLRAPVMLAQAFAAQALEGADAQVINIIDQRVLKPTPQFFSYSLSKAALYDATLTMAQALAPRIRVNGVAPGPTLPSVHQAPGEFEREVAGIPLERAVTPQDIAAAMRYLIEAKSVTGQMIAVDGGQHLAWRTADIVGS